ncbi:uncharacterized protein FA14DRAFT_161487 [Meira miltonrushii]|uniref:Borealin N-terminal domain-containing protein n=1 Tax=Meira miltonrushii TaxID=1280837 RepID=A0A316V862_9BASI|nr:uncharacterized protein FA14DRAFT_161487 [Meira miltonrushii]PWN33817.1 hypothetical protein FA14DRAFT_161487 [Meira miltonrushii]
MPRGIPKSGSASTSVLASSNSSAILAPPPTRHASARSAKIRANASILDNDKDIDALIRKHEKKGARGFAKVRQNPSTTTSINAMEEDGRSDRENDDEAIQQYSKGKKKTTTKGTANSTKQTKIKMLKSAQTEEENEHTESRKKKQPAKSSDEVDEEDNVFSSPQRSVLGESARKNNRAQQASTPPRIKATKVSSSAFASSSSPSKLKISSQSHALQSSPNRMKFLSPSKKRNGMPEIQIESFLENYDLEAENRLRMALKTLQISIDSTRTQMHAKAIAKLPRAVRLMRLGDFVNEYGANIQAAVERAAVVADKARQGAWEEEKMQRKRKGEDEEQRENEEKREGKSAKLDSVKNVTAGARGTAQNGRSKLKNVVRKTRQVVRPSPQKPTESRNESPMRPPSSAVFKPNLGADVVIAERTSSIPTLPPTPANGKARTARRGESVQWLSMNGSPIIGVVAPDGTIHAMPRTIRQSPSVIHQKQKSRNWQAMEEDVSDDEDAAETSAHLLELAKGIDGFKRSRDSDGQSPISRTSLHTAQASRRGTLDTAESEEGESIFEEARSYPDEERVLGLSDDDDCSLPDEEAYTAQIMREEAQKRAKMLSSEPRIARSSASSKAFGNGSGGRSSGSSSLTGMTSKANNARGSHSTIRATSSRKDQTTSNASRSSSSGFLAMPPSSPMVRNNSGGSSKRIMSMSSSTSSSPSKGRVSIVFGSGSRHKITQLGVEDLMKLSAQERNQMLDILEKLKQAQSNLDTR